MAALLLISVAVGRPVAIDVNEVAGGADHEGGGLDPGAHGPLIVGVRGQGEGERDDIRVGDPRQEGELDVTYNG